MRGTVGVSTCRGRVMGVGRLPHLRGRRGWSGCGGLMGQVMHGQQRGEGCGRRQSWWVGGCGLRARGIWGSLRGRERERAQLEQKSTGSSVVWMGGAAKGGGGGKGHGEVPE